MYDSIMQLTGVHLVLFLFVITLAKFSTTKVPVDSKTSSKGRQRSLHISTVNSTANQGCVRVGHVTRDCRKNSTAMLVQITRDWRRNIQHKSEICRQLNAIVSECFPDLISSPCNNSYVEGRHLERVDWLTAARVMLSSCDSLASYDNVDLVCLRHEFSSILWKIYDSEYNFNVEQVPRGICRFISENHKNKYVVIMSSCGIETSHTLLTLLKLLERRRLHQHNCDIHTMFDSKAIQGLNLNERFHFSDKCSQRTVNSFDDCHQKFLAERKLLKFHVDNSLIAVGGTDDLLNSCSNYNQFNSCVKDIQSTCPNFLHLMNNFDSELRVYNDKLNIICSRNKTLYTQSLRCYQNVLRDKLLSPCDTIWEPIQQGLNKVSALDFYCKPSDSSTKQLAGDLRRLRFCYTTVFKETCGSAASKLISSMIEEAFQDPFYLKYTHKPNCRLLLDASAETKTSSGYVASPPTGTLAKIDSKTYRNVSNDKTDNKEVEHELNQISLDLTDRSGSIKNNYYNIARPIYRQSTSIKILIILTASTLLTVS